MILTVIARDAEVGKRPAKGQIGGNLRIGQARIGFKRAMREGNEHQRQCAKR
jgi:hypothetical protein